MRKAFDVEQIDLDDLIETAMTDTRGGAGRSRRSAGSSSRTCSSPTSSSARTRRSTGGWSTSAQVIEFYNSAVDGLPDHNKLKGLTMPGLTTVLDVKGAGYAELYEPNHRRLWVKLADIPEHVQQAFIAAEDKRFFKHKGIDERSVIRAFIDHRGGSQAAGRAARPSPSRSRRTCWSATASPMSARSAR